MNQNQSNILGTEKILKLFLMFSIPALISMTITGLQSIVDGIFVGNFVGPNAMASINIASPFTTGIIGGTMIIAIGGVSFMGRTLGEGNVKRAQDAFKTCLLVLVLIAILVGVCGFTFSDQLAHILGADDTLAADTRNYIRTLACFTPIISMSLILGVISRLVGKPILFLVSSITSLLVNICFNYIFIHKLQLGTTGAALATGLCFTASLIILMVPFFKSSTVLNFKAGNINFEDMPKILYNGSSEGIGAIATATAAFAFNKSFMAHAGAVGVSAFTAVNYLSVFGNLVIIGICTGIGSIISYNYGAGQFDRVRQTQKIALTISTVVGILLFSMLFFFGKGLTSIFVGDSPEVLALSVHGSRLFAFAFLMNGFNVVFSNYFTSIGDALASILVSISRGLVFILLGIAVLPRFFDISGVWITVPFAECITVMIVLGLLYRRKKKNNA